MNTNQRTFHIGLNLPEPEALAISRLAQAEMRDLKSQARFMLRSKLIEMGLLVDESNQVNKTTLKVQS